jgi:hypothetical protein
MTANLFETIHADPWAEQIVDLPTLNASASSAIERALLHQRDVARRAPKELRSTSLVVVGPPGAGKTHLFARLRARLGPKAVFIHVRPLLNSEMTARFVLHEIATQLSYATLGLRQIDAMVGSLLGHLGDVKSSFPRTFLDEMARLDEPERVRRLEEALERVLETWQDLDEGYLRRLLSAPFGGPSMQRAMMAWLSGRECDDIQLKRIGASASLEEASVIPALRTLAAVASLGAPIVVVFDQLENLIDGQGSKSRLLAYANLAAELVDSARGIVLVHMAIDTEWTQAILPALGASHRSRIAMRTQSLSLPTAEEREALLQKWAECVARPLAPFPWPFGERRVARWCSAPGMTPRMLLVECRTALEQGTPDEDPDVAKGGEVANADTQSSHDGAESLKDALAAEWEVQLENARRALDELAEQAVCADPARLADGLATASDFVADLAVEMNLREPAQLTWRTTAGNVRMALLHQNHPRSLGSSLAKLATLAESEPVLAVRQRAQEIPPTWKDTLAKRASFVAKAKARWVPLEREDAARLLALASLLAAARSRDVTDTAGRAIAPDVVRTWVSGALDVPAWPILAALSIGSDDRNEETSQPARGAPSMSGLAFGILRRLRIASLDRLVREVARVDPTATRTSTLLELKGAGERVRWVGSAVVFVKEQP